MSVNNAEISAYTSTKEKTGGYSLAKRMRLILICMVIALLAALLLSIFYIMRKERIETTMRESSGILSGLSDGICSDIARYKELSRLIMVDDELVEYLRTDSDKVDPGLVNISRNSILEILNVTSMVDSVFVFRNDGQYFASNRGKYMFDYNSMEDENWENNILESKGGAVISINADNAIFKLNNSPFVTIGRAVYDISTQQKLGIMLMNISNVCLDQKLFNLSENDILIIGTDGTYLAGDQNIEKLTDISRYFDLSLFEEGPAGRNDVMTGLNRTAGTADVNNNNPELMKADPDFYTVDRRVYTEYGNQDLKIVHDQIKNNRKKYIASVCHVPDMPIVLISLSSIDNGLYMFETVYVMLILMAVFITAVLFAGAFINKNITSPIFELTNTMENNRKSGKLEKINIDIPNNELGVLKDSYNRMVDRVNVLFNNLIDKEKMIQKAEMRVLQEQIKPHFLYNSLETIGFMALDAGAENVHGAIETLGSFYRNFLSKGDREIPFSREISIIRDYLSLQKLRYGDILNDEYDIAENTLNCKIPKLILQPIVENSIYHGIRLKGEAGTIRISSHLDGSRLHIVVRDTGVGMSDEQIENVLSREETDPGDGFGLRGTIERIRYYCGDDDVVNIRSEVGEYTEVEFIIDQKKSRNQD